MATKMTKTKEDRKVKAYCDEQGIVEPKTREDFIREVRVIEESLRCMVNEFHERVLLTAMLHGICDSASELYKCKPEEFKTKLCRAIDAKSKAHDMMDKFEEELEEN